MQKNEIEEIFRRVPPELQCKLCLALRDHTTITVDVLFRMEKNCLILRGRESGTNDEGRAFFIPYSEVVYVRLEKIVSIAELTAMYGPPDQPISEEDNPFGEMNVTETPKPSSTMSETANPHADPGSIAKQNLLERIRAARTSAGVKRG